MFDRLIQTSVTGNSVIYKFTYSTQRTFGSTHRGNTGAVLSPFDIEQGTVLQIKPTAECRFMQYGVLPEPYTFEFYRTNPSGVANYNWAFMLPQKADLLDITDLVANDFSSLQTITRWNHSTQTTTATTIRNGRPLGSGAMLSPMKPLMFFKVLLNNTTSSLTWH